MRRDRSDLGISNLGMILSMAGLLAVLLIVAIVVSLTLPSNSTTDTTATATTAKSTPALGTNQATSPTTTTTVLSSTPSASVVAACQSDAQQLQTALAAYQATSGSNAVPPAPWSAASYASNFNPLTKAQPPAGPYLKGPLVDTHYVILFDASGHVWVEPPGNFGAYNPASDAGSTSVCSRMAR